MYVIMKRYGNQFVANTAPVQWTPDIQQAHHWDRPDHAVEFQAIHRLSDSTIILIDRQLWREQQIKRIMNDEQS